jgi:hypothetical protein
MRELGICGGVSRLGRSWWCLIVLRRVLVEGWVMGEREERGGGMEKDECSWEVQRGERERESDIWSMRGIHKAGELQSNNDRTADERTLAMSA